MNAALVPVKRLGEGKSRLLGALDRDALDALTLAMLGDVVESLMAAAPVDRVAVVTPDDEVAAAAQRHGAEPVLILEPGLNHALDTAAPKISEPDGSLLVVLGDVAGVASADIVALYDALGEDAAAGAVLAAASDGGTAALLRSPPDAFPGHFGADSAAAHQAAAKEAGVPLRVLELASLRTDLDRPEDLAVLLASGGPAPRTRALLRSLGIGSA